MLKYGKLNQLADRHNVALVKFLKGLAYVLVKFIETGARQLVISSYEQL